jgi:hypothetical protein
MNIHKDELDIIGPSIGKPVITAAMQEMLDTLRVRCINEEVMLRAMRQVHEYNEAIAKWYDGYYEAAKTAGALFQEAHDGSSQLSREEQRGLRRNLVMVVFQLEVQIEGRRCKVDKINDFFGLDR